MEASFLAKKRTAYSFCSENSRKEYEAGLRLGLVTNTQDTTGETLESQPVNVSCREVEEALAAFRGEIRQIPPMYSAVKVGGQRLYQLARKGREVEREARQVNIYELELLEQVSETDFRLRCVCSKGTYIRTLCHDIGRALGCGGTMYALRRTMAAGYTLAEAVTIQEVQDRGETLLRPVDSLFSAHPAWTIRSAGQEKRVRNGSPITVPETAEGLYRVYGPDGTFLCLSRAGGGTLTAVKNFF